MYLNSDRVDELSVLAEVEAVEPDEPIGRRHQLRHHRHLQGAKHLYVNFGQCRIHLTFKGTIILTGYSRNLDCFIVRFFGYDIAASRRQQVGKSMINSN